MASWRGIKFNFPRLASHCFSYTEHDIQNTVIHATESSLSSSLSLCNLKFHLAETRYVTGFELEAFFQAGRANFDAYYRLRDAIVRNKSSSWKEIVSSNCSCFNPFSNQRVSICIDVQITCTH